MDELTAEFFQQQVNHETADEIKQLLAGTPSADDLLRHYGEMLGSPATGEDSLATGKRTFRQRLRELREIICTRPSVRALVENPAVDKEVELATVLAGILLRNHFPSAETATVAVLLVRIGVLRLCTNEPLL